MLEELTVKNFALIETLSLKFSDKLNIFTGETGAGKSITIEALGLLLGERANAEMVRTGTPKAVITGTFNLETAPKNSPLHALLKEQDISVDENLLILRREVDSAGKSKCYCNDQPVTVAFLSKIGDTLVDIHGQNEHQTLLKPQNQLNMADSYGDLQQQREKIALSNKQYQSLLEEISNLRLSQQERDQKIDIYKFQVKEIDAADLKPNSEEEIDRILPQLKNSEKLIKLLGDAYYMLEEEDSSVLTRLFKINQIIENVNSISDGAFGANAQLESITAQLKEVASSIEKYRDNLNMDPKELDKLLEKKDLILKLKRKYGATVEEVLAYREKTAAELSKLENSSESINELEKKINVLEKSLLKQCEALSVERKNVCLKLQKLVEKEIRDLGMEKAKFNIAVTKEIDANGRPKITNTGYDKIDYMFSPNVGEEVKPLKAIASGGEMSRTMLALKAVLGKASDVPIMVFDEIDAGVSGPMASVIGSKLEQLSKNRQVFCITHMAQIAGYADTHLKVEKTVKAGRTFTEVIPVDNQAARIEEIARMISGEKITDTARKHAKELLKNQR